MNNKTGIIELAPFMSALISEDAFFTGGDVLHNPEVYVLGKNGTLYQYYQFSLGRSALIEIGKTPIVVDGGKTLLKPYLKPLVNDQKIPVQFLDDIVEFFKRVMMMTGTGGRGHGEYEAMAHIVWNKTTNSYRVAIPKQQVAKATVTYDWAHVKDDEEVILDIHSHNTMGAFFSGTDERDDKTYAGISGVAGELNKAIPAIIWRFNAYKTKVAVELGDIFAVPEKSVSPEVDQWMGNVEVKTYPVYSSTPLGSRVYGGGQRFGNGYDKSPLDEEERDWNARFRSSEEGYTARVGTPRSQASLDILGEDEGQLSDLVGSGLSWDETVEGLAESVWQEDDEEMTVEIAANLAGRVVDTEVLNQAGLFYVENATDARKAVERLHKDFNIRSA